MKSENKKNEKKDSEMQNEEKKEKIRKRLFEITVKAVIVKDKKEVLLLRRSNTDHRYPGKCDLPGGSIEMGEDIESALAREIKEEIGIDTKIDTIIYAIDFQKEYNLASEERIDQFGKGLRYLAHYVAGDVKLSDEHDKYMWLPFDEAIRKLDEDGFEKDKRMAVERAKAYVEMENANENWKRCVADFENYKKRQAERQKETIAFSNMNLILEILPVLDNFHVSTDHVPEDQKKNPWVTGIMHIQKQLEKVLEDNGVSEIPVKEGEKFNPEIHEAICQEEKSENAHPVESPRSGDAKGVFNRVKKVLMKGYKIDPARNASRSNAGGGKIIRAARVIVE